MTLHRALALYDGDDTTTLASRLVLHALRTRRFDGDKLAVWESKAVQGLIDTSSELLVRCARLLRRTKLTAGAHRGRLPGPLGRGRPCLRP